MFVMKQYMMFEKFQSSKKVCLNERNYGLTFVLYLMKSLNQINQNIYPENVNMIKWLS